MKHKGVALISLTLFIITSLSPLFADSTPNPYSCVIDPEFANTDLVYAPLATWAAAGSNAILDSVFTINVLDIPDEITYELEGVETPIPEAQPGEGFDNSLTFNELIKWINSNVDSVLVHTQIYIPEGTYYFSDQITMHTNISLKGAGSHLTTLRFLIRADSTSSTMSKADCRKDAILISGTDDAFRYNCGIEDLKIERIRDGISEGDVKDKVEGYDTNGVQGGKLSYWCNNIAIRRATNC